MASRIYILPNTPLSIIGGKIVPSWQLTIGVVSQSKNSSTGKTRAREGLIYPESNAYQGVPSRVRMKGTPSSRFAVGPENKA